MPGFDQTGPRGVGPMTGRGMGRCGDGMPRGRPFFGRGFGGSPGRGRRFRNRPLTKEEEKKILQEDLKDLEAEKEEIKKQLDEN